MRIVSAAEARALDEKTIAAGTPGILLMERAAAAVAREVLRGIHARRERGAFIAVLAGAGNNGGDGFETARLLSRAPGVGPVTTLFLGDEARLSADASETLRRLRESGGAVRKVGAAADLEPLRRATLVVDALFGTGLTRPLEGLAAEAVRQACVRRAFLVAVDIPSGLNASLGETYTPHVVADTTVTFGLPKTAHVHLPAAGSCGRVVVADIGLLADEEPSGGAGAPEAVTSADIAPLFPRRPADAHKGTYGRVGILGGSDGMLGAPALAARAAHRSGAGLVTVIASEEVRRLVHALSPESTTAAPGWAPAFDALAVGSGLGTSKGAREVVHRAIGEAAPAVFDADALNAAAGKPELFVRAAPTVLTPHPGEAGRLLGRSAADVNADRVSCALEIARRSRSVVILKGFRSLVATPEGRVHIVLAGNPGMASGGMGDVLTGIVGSFLARGFSAVDAARAGAYLHGLAGDLAREAVGEEALVATDIVDTLGSAFAVIAESAPS